MNLLAQIFRSPLKCVVFLFHAGAAVTVSSNCSEPLGMEDGRITDQQLTASSSYEPNLVGPANGRLNSERGGGAWCPKSLIDDSSDTEEYLEVDLIKDHVISALLVQGRYANGLGKEFTEYVALQFKQQSQHTFNKYTDRTGASLIKANFNTFQVVKYNLSKVIVASKVRIIPLSVYPRTVCLRIELEGCEYPGNFFSVLAEETRIHTDLGMRASSSVAEEEEWNQNIYLAIAIGILVTVICASGAAVALVLYRSKVQEEKPSISRYNFINADSDSSLQHPPEMLMREPGDQSLRAPGGAVRVRKQIQPQHGDLQYHRRVSRRNGSSRRSSNSPEARNIGSLDSWGYISRNDSWRQRTSNSLRNIESDSLGKRRKAEPAIFQPSSTRNPLYAGDIIRYPQNIYRTRSRSVSSSVISGGCGQLGTDT